jgi:hypothetical protein
MKNVVLYYNIKTLKTPMLFNPCGINIREPVHQMILYNTSKKHLTFYMRSFDVQTPR